MILRIIIFLILGLILPALYIDRQFLKKKSFRLLLWIPNTVLLTAAITLALFESFSPWSVWAKGTFLLVYLCVVIPETFFTLVSLIGLVFKRFTPVRKAINYIGLATALFLLSAILFGYFYGYKNIVVKNYDYTHPDIPKSFDGYRIVQFSDMHIGTFSQEPEMVDKIVKKINSLQADAIFFTGDMVNYRSSELSQFTHLMKKLRAKDGVFSVMGNHDYMGYYQWKNKTEMLNDIQKLQQLQRGMGWNLLLNDSRNVVRGNDTIAVVGVENDGKPPFPQYGDIPKAMSKVSPNTKFKLLLSHDPTHWKRRVLSETDIQLTFSGHTHGMQFKIGSFSPAEFFYDEWGGIYYEENRALLVSVGLGQVLLPIRFGAWPEIEVITLHSK